MIFNSHIGLSILLIGFIACKDKPKVDAPMHSINPIDIDIDSLFLKAGEGLVYYLSEPFSGNGVSYLEGIKVVHIEYVHGKKHGYYRKWFKSGVLSFESEYSQGRRHGTTQTWWKNRNQRSESNFVQGIANGQQKQWYKSGAIFKVRSLVSGKEEGMQQSWRENGKLYNNYEAKNGRIFGLKRATLCYKLDDENIRYEK